MKLIYSVPSPYARKARVALIEARLEGRVETEAIDPWADPPGFRGDNPLGKVPTLTRDDGPPLFQSNAVCEYLNFIGDAQLYPTDGPNRWAALRQLALADGILDASVTARMELTFHEPDQISHKLVERQELSVVVDQRLDDFSARFRFLHRDSFCRKVGRVRQDCSALMAVLAASRKQRLL